MRMRISLIQIWDLWSVARDPVRGAQLLMAGNGVAVGVTFPCAVLRSPALPRHQPRSLQIPSPFIERASRVQGALES
jgi:hypothetical protein